MQIFFRYFLAIIVLFTFVSIGHTQNNDTVYSVIFYEFTPRILEVNHEVILPHNRDYKQKKSIGNNFSPEISVSHRTYVGCFLPLVKNKKGFTVALTAEANRYELTQKSGDNYIFFGDSGKSQVGYNFVPSLFMVKRFAVGNTKFVASGELAWFASSMQYYYRPGGTLTLLYPLHNTTDFYFSIGATYNFNVHYAVARVLPTIYCVRKLNRNNIIDISIPNWGRWLHISSLKGRQYLGIKIDQLIPFSDVRNSPLLPDGPIELRNTYARGFAQVEQAFLGGLWLNAEIGYSWDFASSIVEPNYQNKQKYYCGTALYPYFTVGVFYRPLSPK